MVLELILSYNLVLSIPNFFVNLIIMVKEFGFPIF